MADGTVPVAIVGSTGMLGSAILQRLLHGAPSATPVHAITRRALSATVISNKLEPHVEADSAKWATVMQGIAPKPSVFISSLGTTRASAGSVEAQRKIDVDLNLELARAAKEMGIPTYVLVSSAGSSSSSRVPYSKMKGEVEDEVKKMGFQHTVILRPGLLPAKLILTVGNRQESRMAEGVLQGLAKGMGALSKNLTNFWAQDVDTIGRATVQAVEDCADGKREPGVWVLEQADIVRLGAAK